MKAICSSFRQMILFLKNDMMLAVACGAPVLIGIAFRFGIPLLERILTGHFGMEEILTQYYPVFDLFLACITPVFYCFVAAMVMLEERDDHIMTALHATPLGQTGYFISRLGLPGVFSFLITEIMTAVFSLTALSAVTQLLLALDGAAQGVMFSLLVVTLSSNKLEGMAVTKLTSLIILGAVVPWFVPERVQFVFWLLPSFWMGKMVWGQEHLLVLPSLILAVLWIYVLLRRSARRGCNRRGRTDNGCLKKWAA
ncbi:ABC transporter permease [Hespellia stercorisuis]|uniref:Fluoroquinolone transport system permease protein n=1 Tax=Hespellia stercorisuis DSM 15480 TaxID=1121950 RepID=A0A1M6MKX1_9FIRM|nr:hypothetical protein [Hespellia stercorisuis]SHJ84107.1 fluoroquinolone transport system permease protein [Hespellia stercorisuis DSM 15480]